MSTRHELSPAGVRALAVAERIGVEIAGPVADDVDRAARFPSEAIAALRTEGLLGALVPASHGGVGITYTDLAAICTALGQHCASAAMVFAMHQIQVACLVEHCQGIPHFDDLLRDLAVDGRLIASATTEAGIGGDVRSSICAVESDGAKFTLSKNASVISYGSYVDDVLVTARRDPAAPANDQVMVHVHTPNLTLEPVGEWDTIGMRGTCSIGYILQATGTIDQIMPVPYADMSSVTMLPVSHITWAALWLGIAENAMTKARAYVRSAARKNPGTVPPIAQRLAEAYADLDRIRSTVDAAVREFERARIDPDVASSMGFAIKMNNLKITVSHDVLELIQKALFVCGISGFRNDTPYSLGRQLRDATSSSLMVHNDRILNHNASLLCVMKDG